MYMFTLKTKQRVRLAVRAAALLAWLVFLVILMLSTMSKAHAGYDLSSLRDSYYLMVKKPEGLYTWANLGVFEDRKACDYAAFTLMKIPREIFICVPTHSR